MSLSELQKQLAVERDGVRLVDLCVEIVLLLDGPIMPAMPAIQRIYNEFMAHYGASIHLCCGYDDCEMRSFEPTEWRDMSRWLDAGLSLGSGSFGAHFKAAKTHADARPPAFDAVHYAPSRELARGGVRIMLPLETLRNGSDHLRDSFVAMLEGLPLNHALCGLSFSWDGKHNDAEKIFETFAVPRLLRHPGVEMGDFPFLVLHAPAGIMTINWLTALGPRLAYRLGGAGSLADIPPECNVHILQDGVIAIQAGPAPMAGDVNRNDLLPAYRAVARALRPAWAPHDYIANISYPMKDDELGDRWIELERFF